MNAFQFFDALGKIDDKYVMEAAGYTRKRKNIWIRCGVAAACVCAVIVFFAVRSRTGLSPDKNPITVTGDGVHIPKMNVDLSANSSADMVAFFIWQNRSYIYYDTMKPVQAIEGEYLGTATGLLDEWSAKEEYVEFAGSIAGDFYSVQGYDPEFMLCIKENDSVALFINNNGITLKTGTDLFETRLSMAGRYDIVEYQTREDWFYGNGSRKTLDTTAAETLSAFVSALSEAPFMRIADIPLDEGETDAYTDKEIYHMFFRMNDGVTVHLRLFAGGYVQFDGIMGVCVHMPEECFQAMIRLLAVL